MKAFFIILGLILIAFGIYALWKAYKKSKEPRTQRPTHIDPFIDATGARKFAPDILAPGAVLSHGGTDYVVRGSLEVRQGPYVWYEHMMDGGSGSEWLGVEVDEGVLELVLWRTMNRSQQDNPQSRMEIDGVVYMETERGHADYTSKGTTGVGIQGRLQYVDYRAQADQLSQLRLSFERYGEDAPWEVSRGEVVSPGEFTVYPAPEN